MNHDYFFNDLRLAINYVRLNMYSFMVKGALIAALIIAVVAVFSLLGRQKEARRGK